VRRPSREIKDKFSTDLGDYLLCLLLTTLHAFLTCMRLMGSLNPRPTTSLHVPNSSNTFFLQRSTTTRARVLDVLENIRRLVHDEQDVQSLERLWASEVSTEMCSVFAGINLVGRSREGFNSSRASFREIGVESRSCVS
jgi:hypothetical protein